MVRNEGCRLANSPQRTGNLSPAIQKELNLAHNHAVSLEVDPSLAELSDETAALAATLTIAS